MNRAAITQERYRQHEKISHLSL